MQPLHSNHSPQPEILGGGVGVIGGVVVFITEVDVVVVVVVAVELAVVLVPKVVDGSPTLVVVMNGVVFSAVVVTVFVVLSAGTELVNESVVIDTVVVVVPSGVTVASLPVSTMGRVIIRVNANTIQSTSKTFFQTAQLETVSKQLLLDWSFISLTFAMVESEFQTLKITQKFHV